MFASLRPSVLLLGHFREHPKPGEKIGRAISLGLWNGVGPWVRLSCFSANHLCRWKTHGFEHMSLIPAMSRTPPSDRRSSVPPPVAFLIGPTVRPSVNVITASFELKLFWNRKRSTAKNVGRCLLFVFVGHHGGSRCPFGFAVAGTSVTIGNLGSWRPDAEGHRSKGFGGRRTSTKVFFTI